MATAKEMKGSSVNITTQNNEQNMGECFVIMPISDPDGYTSGHFRRVYEDIFIPAIGKAGFKPFRADDNNSASLIQLEIIRRLIESPMALCDLSTRNPNVLFELGIRQAFDKPVALIQEYGTPRIFDISSINTIDYRRERIYNEVLEDQDRIAKALKETYESYNKGKSVNSIVKLLSLQNPAKLEDIEQLKQDPAIQYLISEMSGLRSEMIKITRQREEISDYEVPVNKTPFKVNSRGVALARKQIQKELIEKGEINEDYIRTIESCKAAAMNRYLKTKSVEDFECYKIYESMLREAINSSKVNFNKEIESID